MEAQQTDQQRRNINAAVAVRQNTAKPKRKADPASRQWQITVIPSDEAVYDEIQNLVGSGDADYVCIGREICPETHLNHFHAHIIFKTGRKASWIRTNISDTAHREMIPATC